MFQCHQTQCPRQPEHRQRWLVGAGMLELMPWCTFEVLLKCCSQQNYFTTHSYAGTQGARSKSIRCLRSPMTTSSHHAQMEFQWKGIRSRANVTGHLFTRYAAFSCLRALPCQWTAQSYSAFRARFPIPLATVALLPGRTLHRCRSTRIGC